MLYRLRRVLKIVQDAGDDGLKGLDVTKCKAYFLKISGNSEMHSQDKDPILIERAKAGGDRTRRSRARCGSSTGRRR